MKCIFFNGILPLLISVVSALLMTFSSDFLQAGSLNPGDIVTCAQSSGILYRTDPSSGTTTVISSGGLLSNPFHLMIDSQGRILAAERSYGPGIVRTDATGSQTSIASGPLFTFPTALAFDANQNLFVGNGIDVISVNMQTGESAVVASLTEIGGYGIQDLEVDRQGRFVALAFGDFNSGTHSKIVRFDPATGQQTVVAAEGYLFNPVDLVINPNGDYIVSNRLMYGTSTQILDVNPNTGSQTIVSTVPTEGFIALQDPNNIVYVGSGSLIRVNLLSGETQQYPGFTYGDITGVAVYSPVPEPSTLAMLLIVTLGGLLLWQRRS